MNKLPIQLKNDPIIDCTLEMRFESASNSVANVLPGILYSKLEGKYQSKSTVESELPRELRASDATLKYRPVVYLVGDEERIGIGESCISISFRYPYKGWQHIESKAVVIFTEVFQSGLISRVERISARYQNLIDTLDDPHDLSPLKLQLDVGGGLEVRGPGTNVRCETESEGTTSIIQIITGATAKVESVSLKQPLEKRGLVVAIDTVKYGHIDGAEALQKSLKLIHDNEKKVFFSLLTEATINEMGPIWE